MVEKTLSTIGILEAAKEVDVCPLCSLWSKYERKLLDYFLTNEASMDPDIRSKVVKAVGFCSRHMHLLYQEAFSSRWSEDGLGYAQYMRDICIKLLDALIKIDNEANKSSKAKTKTMRLFLKKREPLKPLDSIKGKMLRLLSGELVCPICEMLLEADRRRAGTLIRMLDDPEFREQFIISNHVCLPHFVLLTHQLSHRKKRDTLELISLPLIQMELAYIKKVTNQLSERIRKYSWEYRNETLGEESEAQKRALELIVGYEGLYPKSKKDTSWLDFEE